MTTRPLVLATLALLATTALGCRDKGEPQGAARGDTMAAAVSLADVRQPTPFPRRFGDIGRRATREEIAAWDIDVEPDGHGLPPGRGTYAAGASLFAARCAACHGTKGEGLATYPKLIGREPRAGFPFGRDLRYVKTVGNYWPYATTVYDYVHRAMPLTAPGSLKPDEVYSVVEYLLAENEIVPRTTVLDAKSLPRVRMPARDRFVRDDRGGATFR